MFSTVGAAREPFWPLMPIEPARLSVHPFSGLWQVAQLTVPSFETRASK